jgi:chromosomal replication initiation ATPase DnaA
MYKNPYKGFIRYLDKYQRKKEFSFYDAVILQQQIQTYYLNNYTNILETSYETWQNENEVQVVLKNEIKEYKSIDISIHSLQDILHLLKDHTYDSKYEYNIDLKALHDVKTELELLNNMIGMETLKKSVMNQIIYFIQELHISSNSLKNDYKHTILMGPPGTGKTEIAKIIGVMYSKLGILKKNVFKKVTRTDLVAGYLGQTAIKTRKVIDECLGGVLFIDEAYALGGDDSFSKECIDTLCEALSDHKDNLMVIIAGYEKELNETFFRINSGMYSRFIWKFTIESYNSKELMYIFKKQIDDHEWELHEDFLMKESWFQRNKDSFLHYGRDMELLFSYVKISHAQRIFGKEKKKKKKITEEDLENGFQLFIQNKNTKKKDLMSLHSMYV